MFNFLLSCHSLVFLETWTRRVIVLYRCRGVHTHVITVS